MVRSLSFHKFLFPILILLALIIVFHVAAVSVVYKIRTSIESEYDVLQENLLEKLNVFHKIVSAANRVISYDPGPKSWEEIKKDLWNFNSPIMGDRLLTEKFSEDILNRILGEDPLGVKERSRNTLIEYRVKLNDVFDHASLLRKSEPGLGRDTLFYEYQHKMQNLLVVLNQYYDELMQIQDAYFSYLKNSLLKTMSLLSKLVYSLVAFVTMTVFLVMLFILERRRFEIALVNSKLNLENIFEAAIPMCVTNKEFIITQANSAYTSLFGAAGEEVVGRKCYESRPGNNCNEDNCPARGIFNGMTEIKNEARKICLNSQEIYCIVTAKPFRNSRGELTGVVESFQDISERRRAEERIQRLNMLNEDLLILKDLDSKLVRITDGIVEIFHADFARIWTVENGDLCESGCCYANADSEMGACQDRDRCLHLRASSGRSTHIDGLMHDRVPLALYNIGRVADGREDRFLVNDVPSDPFFHDKEWARQLGLVSFAGYRLSSDEGRVIGVLGLFSRQAISNEEDALLEGLARSASLVIQKAVLDEELRKSEEQYSNLFHFSNDSILLHDLAGNVLNINRKGVEQFQYSRSEIFSLKEQDLHPSELIEKSGRFFQKLKESEFMNYEIDFQKKSGAVFPAEVSSSLFKIGTDEVIMSIIRDITERKQAEQEREKIICRLQEALNEVHTLQGFLPICSNCKKIRDDEGYWQQIEQYIMERSTAQFSHGICPDCARKLYPEFF